MNRGFYTAIAGLNTQLARMEIISNNLANAETAGFKRETAVISSFQEMTLVNLNSKGNYTGPPFSREIGTINQGSLVREVVTDFGPGILIKTDKTGDLAIAGEGFFCLEDEGGNRYYTRSGRFHVDVQGYIVHTSGMRLLGEGGPLKVSGGEFTVSGGGKIFSGNSEIGRILICRFDDPSVLQKSGNNLYSAPVGEKAIAVERPEVRQGYIEASNTDPVKEMVTAVEVLRAYQAGQKLAQAHDRLLDLAIGEVGKLK